MNLRVLKRQKLVAYTASVLDSTSWVTWGYLTAIKYSDGYFRYSVNLSSKAFPGKVLRGAVSTIRVDPPLFILFRYDVIVVNIVVFEYILKIYLWL